MNEFNVSYRVELQLEPEVSSVLTTAMLGLASEPYGRLVEGNYAEIAALLDSGEIKGISLSLSSRPSEDQGFGYDAFRKASNPYNAPASYDIFSGEARVRGAYKQKIRTLANQFGLPQNLSSLPDLIANTRLDNIARIGRIDSRGVRQIVEILMIQLLNVQFPGRYPTQLLSREFVDLHAELIMRAVNRSKGMAQDVIGAKVYDSNEPLAQRLWRFYAGDEALVLEGRKIDKGTKSRRVPYAAISRGEINGKKLLATPRGWMSLGLKLTDVESAGRAIKKVGRALNSRLEDEGLGDQKMRVDTLNIPLVALTELTLRVKLPDLMSLSHVERKLILRLMIDVIRLDQNLKWDKGELDDRLNQLLTVLSSGSGGEVLTEENFLMPAVWNWIVGKMSGNEK